jgi:glycosyltransferase involved in cell wall biosynthesis
VEDYLPETVNSIINQTYKNLEIILIDDGSPDRCGDMCEEYAVMDRRVKVIHKVNGGLSSARNIGLQVCSGEFIFCIDSDDVADIHVLGEMVKAAQNTKANLVTCGVKDFIDGEKVDFSNFVSEEKPIIYISLDACKMMFYMREISGGVLGHLIHKDLLNYLVFEENKLYEDVIPVFLCTVNANKVAHLNQDLCAYRHRVTSQSNQGFSIKEMDNIEMLQKVMNIIIHEFPELKKSCASKVLSSNLHVLSMIPMSDRSKFSKQIKVIWDNVKKYRKTVLNDKEARKKAKYGAILSYAGCFWMHWIGRCQLKYRDKIRYWN